MSSTSTESVETIPTKYIQTPSSYLLCPICGGLYRDPVINVKCGHTFCKSCIFSITHCPIDNIHCDTNQYVINRLVVGQIEDLQIYCRHGLIKQEDGEWGLDPSLCPQILTLGKRNEHENSCIFAVIPCPNSDQCKSLQRQHLDKHLLECSYVPCPFKNDGCNFQSTARKVTDHSLVCTFRQKEEHAGNVNKEVDELALDVQRTKAENVKLASRVAELEAEKSQMATQLQKHWNFIQSLQLKLEVLTSRVDQLNIVNVRRPMSASQVSLDGGSPGINSPTSALLLRGSSPGHSFEKWEMPFQFKCIGTLRGHKDVVWCMTTRKGKIFSGDANGIIKVWSLEQLAKGCINNIKAHTGVIYCLAAWGNTIVSGGADKSIALWDIETSEQTNIIEEAHNEIICSMVVVINLLFTSSFAVIKVWDLKSLELKATLPGMNHWVRALALSTNKDKLFSGSHNAINVWDTCENFQKLATIEHECGSVYSLAVNKTYLIAGTYNQNIQLFNVENYQFIQNLLGHIGTVTTLVISPSGRFLFSASHDCNIQMWSLEKLLPIQTLSRHQSSVNTLTLHGDYLLSGSADHEIKVFRYFQIQ
ncbi:E3 ubiquitin-protein ligase TRAF7-like isoform X2 [Physella acuta]|uniref:E3 ubiquitin-protein ligase TRAF7-like isoform X2 n=1 Tax=Physella acuta TaxID=109671 RepID=UPI0027DD9113|nr:E3 ubiquitin-protein ligase TRAF7-like isoform X2 [Physella acuta]